ncbi:Nicotinate-nucleotide--dimethylbenzimidazole phosphoribosyltransferase [hydrothermal vent metagenome]|uniref:Nicotinate-nucleotide--dimethylbenzimidazole phosphoribosyltransferase n=1 Tax=hydrothermal vent metagenome TaxID=652676 RepID=A0A3B0QZP2_9ZZZZ
MKPNQSDGPFKDIRGLFDKFPEIDQVSINKVQARDAKLTKPPGSLGRLEEIAEWLAGWQAQYPPKVDRPVTVVFAGNHGVVAQGVAAYPAEVTAQMVTNFQTGGAAVNQICETFGAGLKVFELALEIPTKDITREAAMDEATCAATIAFGMEAIADNPDLLCIGEMGIGNTTIAAALCHGLYGGTAAEWVGPGTGVDRDGLARKVDAVERAVTLHKGHLDDPLELLRRLGGREIAAMIGAILAARTGNIPVLIDGYIATAAAAVIHAISPTGLDHCIAAHCSAEPAHAKLLEKIDKVPLLNLGLHLGEGSGASLAIGIVQAAANLHNGMATFEQAGVSDKE